MADRYSVEFTRQAEKDLNDFRGNFERAIQLILELEEDPKRGRPLSGSLRGTRSLEFSLKGSGVYRALYVLKEEDRKCLVFIVGPRENIYARAERRVGNLRRS